MLAIIKLTIVKGNMDDRSLYWQADGSYGDRETAFVFGTMVEAKNKINQLKSDDTLIITLYN